MACKVSQVFLALKEKKVVKENLDFQVLLDQLIQIFWDQKEKRENLAFQVFLGFQDQKATRDCLETQGNLDSVENPDCQDYQVPRVILVFLVHQDLQDLLDLKDTLVTWVFPALKVWMVPLDLLELLDNLDLRGYLARKEVKEIPVFQALVFQVFLVQRVSLVCLDIQETQVSKVLWGKLVCLDYQEPQEQKDNLACLDSQEHQGFLDQKV